MKKRTVNAGALESMKSLSIPDKNDFVKAGLGLSEKILNSFIDTANSVDKDCRIKADELFSFFTADVIKKDVVFYK